MKSTNRLESKVEKAMASVDGIQPAAPSAYFYNKILLKLEKPKETASDIWASLLLKPSVIVFTICVIVFLNAFVILHNLNSNKVSEVNTVAITDEYNQTTTPSYYLENAKP